MILDLAFHDPLAYATIVFVLIASIVLHELGHALVATWEGDPTPRMRGHITWNPVVHMGWMSIALIAIMGIGWGQTPVNRLAFRHRRWGAVLVSAAGPAVNLFLAVVAAFVLALGVKNGVQFVGLAGVLWTLTLKFNVLLLLFNMIPIPPLDGFSVLDGTFDLGELGAHVRRAGMLAFVVAIVIVNSDAFDHVWAAATTKLLDVAARCVGA